MLYRGGWVLSQVVSDLATYSPALKCGVVPHPSLGVENMVFKRSVEELVQGIKVPCLWLPAGNIMQHACTWGSACTVL